MKVEMGIKQQRSPESGRKAARTGTCGKTSVNLSVGCTYYPFRCEYFVKQTVNSLLFTSSYQLSYTNSMNITRTSVRFEHVDGEMTGRFR
jgi:hypothetical protein